MRFSLIVVPALAASIISTSALAVQGSKFSTTLSKTALMNETTNGSAIVMDTTIHTANQKELLIGVSLETGLYTQTEVKGKNGEKDSASAMAGIDVTVYIDGVPAEPGTITFNQREQKLTAVLGGVIETCTFGIDQDSDGLTDDSLTVTIEDNCIVSDEELELVQNTMSAHHFNFVAPNLTAGDHTISVEAVISTDSSSGDGSSSAVGLVGKGSLTVESVRAINQDGGITVLE